MSGEIRGWLRVRFDRHGNCHAVEHEPGSVQRLRQGVLVVTEQSRCFMTHRLEVHVDDGTLHRPPDGDLAQFDRVQFDT